MTRGIEYFIALRYLLSKRKVRFINVIGIISVAGIAIGVAALLIVLSVFNGFGEVVTDVLVGFDPHVRIQKKGAVTETELKEIEAIIVGDSRVRGFSPYVSGKAMLVARSYNRVAFITGIDPARIHTVSGLREKIIYGDLTMAADEKSDGLPMIVGLSLADRLESIIGAHITVISPAGMQTAFSGIGVPETMKFRVSGIFESNNKDYDGSYAYISLEAAQRLFRMEGKYSGVELRLEEWRDAGGFKDDIGPLLPAGYEVLTWYDLHRTLYSVMKIERWSAYILLTLIIVVATFNMLGSLTMGVIEKRRDIGVLKSLGLPARKVVRIFMFEGLLIGIAGTFLGIALGLLVLYLQVTYQLFALDTTIYIIPAIPVKIHWDDFLVVAGASLFLSTLASYYPARRAANLIPAESIHWE